jgi:hypothetical protein
MPGLTESQLSQAAEQLVIDERQELLHRAVCLRGVADKRGFVMDWLDGPGDTMHRLRGVVMPQRSYVSYSLSMQTGEDEPSKLRFDENSSQVRLVVGPLQDAVRYMSYEQKQIFLGGVVHQALGNLVLDSYGTAQVDDKL